MPSSGVRRGERHRARRPYLLKCRRITEKQLSNPGHLRGSGPASSQDLLRADNDSPALRRPSLQRLPGAFDQSPCSEICRIKCAGEPHREGVLVRRALYLCPLSGYF